MFQRFLLWKSLWIYLCKCAESNISIHSCKRYHFLNHHHSSKQDSWVLQEGWVRSEVFWKKGSEIISLYRRPSQGNFYLFRLSWTPSVQNDQNRGGSNFKMSWALMADCSFISNNHTQEKKTFLLCFIFL